jgi:hypothetical protein
MRVDVQAKELKRFWRLDYINHKIKVLASELRFTNQGSENPALQVLM